MRHAAVLAFSTFAILGCQNFSGVRSDPAKTDIPRSSRASMKAASESFADLLELSSDPVRFNGRSYEVLIDSELTRLAQIPALPGDDRDPALKTLENRFSEQMVDAKRRWNNGNRNEARALIHSATNYCISCHGQFDHGMSFSPPVGSYLADLGPVERVNFEFAFGHFDQGLNDYFVLLDNPGKTPPERLEQLSLRAMAIAVAKKADPELADRIAVRVMGARWAPVHLQLGADRWRAAIRDWKAQRPLKGTLDQAKILMALAWNKQVHSPLSRAGLIEALRASAILHRQLSDARPGQDYAEALYLSGLNSEILAELDPIPLNTAYYSACIRQAPHSSVARQCYLRLEGIEVADVNRLDRSPTKARGSLRSLRRLAASDEISWMDWGQGRD